MSRTCAHCEYYPIGPYIDNCPLCGEPVRGGRGPRRRADDDDGSEAEGGHKPFRPPVALIIGWAVIGLAFAAVYWGDWLWLLALGLCAAAWYGVAGREEPPARILGGGLLALFAVGFVIALQPHVLPGLDQRARSPERMMHEMMSILRGGSPDGLRTAARMRTITAAILPLFILVVVPPASLIPPLFGSRDHQSSGGRVLPTVAVAVAGLVVWLLILPGAGWLSWPVVRAWADAPPGGDLNWPHGWPGKPPAGLNDDGDDDPDA